MPPLRPFMALAAMLVITAKSALATTPVEVARAQEVAAPATTAEAIAAAPESPLAIASRLTLGDPVLQIELELRATEPPQNEASLLEIPFEGASD